MRSALLKNTDVIAFGTVHSFASSVGQTFFIALFVPYFLTAFALERTLFSTIYGGCTIASALVLPYVGGLLDKVTVRKYALVATLTLSAGALLLSLSQHLVVFIIALFLVRCTGQGVMTDINLTSTGRFFSASRGKAIGITTLGHALGEGILPLLVIALLARGDWRETWQTLSLGLIGVSVLGFVLLLRRKDTSPSAFQAEDDEAPETETKAPARQWTRGEVLRTPAFYLIMPFWVLPAVLLTGFFFHQLALADEKGWSHAFIATSFVYFAVFRGLTSFLAGPLVDKLSARRLMVWSLIPLLLGIGLLALTNATWAAPLYFGLCGTMGISSTTKGAFLPELFGTEHLGAIRALTVTAAVLSTAICPPLFSLILDAGFNFQDIAMGSVVFGILSMVLCAAGIRRLEAIVH